MLKKPQPTDEELEAELETLKKQREEEENPEKSPEELEAEAVIADPDAPKEDKNWAKRYNDTKSAWYKERHEKDSRIKELEEQLSSRQEQEPAQIPTDLEGLKEWKDEYPEVAKNIEAIAREIAAKEVEASSSTLKEKVDTLAKKEKEATLALTKKKVMEVHPEFDDFAASAEFHDWVKEQDSWVEKALYEGMNAKTAIQALTLYKVDNGLLQSEEKTKRKPGRPKKSETDAAKMVSKTKTTNPPSESNKSFLKESDILNWDDAEWEKNRSAYDEARRNGKILYDVTYADSVKRTA